MPIKEIQLPERVTTIGKKAFNDCDYLTEFVIPEGVKESPAPEACGGKNHVHSVNFAKKGFTFAPPRRGLEESINTFLFMFLYH